MTNVYLIFLWSIAHFIERKPLQIAASVTWSSSNGDYRVKSIIAIVTLPWWCVVGYYFMLRANAKAGCQSSDIRKLIVREWLDSCFLSHSLLWVLCQLEKLMWVLCKSPDCKFYITHLMQFYYGLWCFSHPQKLRFSCFSLNSCLQKKWNFKSANLSISITFVLFNPFFFQRIVKQKYYWLDYWLFVYSALIANKI